IVDRLRGSIQQGAQRIVIECYPGVFTDHIEIELGQAFPDYLVIRAQCAWKPPAEIEQMVARDLTEDPVFGRMNGLTINDFVDSHRLEVLRTDVRSSSRPVLVVGTGAFA